MSERSGNSGSLRSVRSQLVGFFAAFLVLEVVILALAISFKYRQSELHKDERVLLRARELVNNALAKSDELHRLIKEAIASGDPNLIREYESQARPQPSDAEYQGGNVILKSLPNMRQRAKDPEIQQNYELSELDAALAASQEQVREGLRKLSTRAAALQSDDLAKLEDAIAASKDQRATELKALNALKGSFQDSHGDYSVTGTADPSLAAGILADPNYEKALNSAKSGFAGFLSLLDVRLFAVHKESSKSFHINFLIALSAMLLLITPVIAFILYRETNKTIRSLKKNLRRLNEHLGDVSSELKVIRESRKDALYESPQFTAQQKVSEESSVRTDLNSNSTPRDDSQPEFNDFLTRLP